MVGTAESQRRRQRQSKKRKTSKSIQSTINTARERLNAGDESSDASASPRSRTPAKKKGCAKTSPIWNHCYNKEVNGTTITCCKYCPKVCWTLNGSTSTALYHVKQHHFEKLTPEEVDVMAEKLKGKTSPSSKLPARSPKAASSMFRKISHDSKKGQELNIKLMLALISSSVPFNILDNAECFFC